MTKTLNEQYNLSNKAKGDELDRRPEAYQSHRIDDQVRPSNALIDFWLANGDQRAFAYNHLYDVDWKLSEGLILTFSEHQVTIVGHDLTEIYRGLKRHRVVYVWEASQQEATIADDGESVVTKIDIQPKTQPFDIH